MDMKSWGWVGLFIALSLSSLGFCWIFVVFVCFLIFSMGFISYLHSKLGDVDKFTTRLLRNRAVNKVFEGGIPKFAEKIDSPNKTLKSDNRVTGSDLIDSSLQEILSYVIRDYILPWYNLISRDEEFPEISVKKTAQTLAINISNRVKEIDWIPYFTTRLVDEAASHLRLFKQAKTKMKLSQSGHNMNYRSSPLKDGSISRGSPKKTHKRNKSETDINWYHNKKEQEKIVGFSKFYGVGSEKRVSLEEMFFDLELVMEGYQVCRDGVCENTELEREYLSELVQILLYVLLPDGDFQCKPFRFLLREIIVNVVILPLLAILSDPDYINRTIIWLCLGDAQLPSDIFLNVLRITDNVNELKSTKELVTKEIQVLRSRDSGGGGGDSDSGSSTVYVKQKLSSLFYVLKLIDDRILKMENSDVASDNLEYGQLDSSKRVDLTMEQILKNNVALSHYMDYITNQNKQADLFFYLNIEGWKVSVEQQLSEIHLKNLKGHAENIQAVYNTIRTTALSIFDQYLGEKSSQNHVQIKLSLVQSLYFKIRNLNEVPNDLWFDEVQQFIYDKMENHPDFLPAFKKSKIYVKLLQELDLIQQTPNEYDNMSLNSDENLEVTISETKNEIALPPFKVDENAFLCVENVQKGRHMRSFSDVDVAVFMEGETSKPEENEQCAHEQIEQQNLKSENYALGVNIIETGVVCEKGKTFGIYAVRVSRQYDTGFLEEWHIYRRYSDFHDLYTKVKEKYQDLNKLVFPGKKTFHNMERAVLEKRMKMLGSYMNEICDSKVIQTHEGLRELLMTFLEQGDYDRATGGPISTTIDNLVNPIKTGMKTIKNMPEQLINTVDEVVGGISKVFNTKSMRQQESSSKVGAVIEETDDNIPLRIFLLLMDEVFDLKSRNQWLRRRMVTLLRQFIRAMFGDIVNRKILDYVSLMTSPKNVAHYLYVFKQSFWPNGNKYEKGPDRDENTKNRTRVAAKVALLSCLSDELKHIIGSETTRRGLITVFELFQNPTLNKRLLYVLLEGILITLFPEKNLNKIFYRLHSKSKRYQIYLKNKSNIY